MRRILKRCTGCILAILMMAAVLPQELWTVNVMAVGEITTTVGGSTYTLGMSGNGRDTWITGWSGTDTDIVIPEWTSWGAHISSISADAFKDCTTISSVTIPASVSVSAKAFTGCTGLEAINIAEGHKYSKSVDGVLCSTSGELQYYPANKAGESYKIPEGITKIASGAFADVVHLKKVEIPSSMSTLDFSGFKGAKRIETVEIPASVTMISSGRLPYIMSHKGPAVVPEGDYITDINVAKDNTVYSSQDGILYNKAKDTLLLCPTKRSGRVTIPSGVSKIEERAFINCVNMTEVDIPPTLANIGEAAFYNCSGLQNVNISSGVRTIEAFAFSCCTSLNSVAIPDSVNSIKIHAFGYKDILNTELDFSVVYNANFKIYGTKGSEAEAYAKKNNFPFSEEARLCLYSLQPIRWLQKGKQAQLLAVLCKGDSPVENQGEFSFVVEDNSIAEIGEMQQTDEGTFVTITAKNEGTTTLTVTSSKTGECAYSPITVGTSGYNFLIDRMPERKMDGKTQYDFYISGMYADAFKKQDNGDSYNVTMDIYNSTSVIGAVDVYNSNNELIRSVPIDKFEGGNLTSFKDTIYSAIQFVADLKNQNLFSYKAGTYSKCTPINIDVPKGGHLVITNNITESDSCYLYNQVDLFVYTLECGMDMAFSDEMKQDVSKRIYQEIWEQVKSGDVLKSYIDDVCATIITEFGVGNATQILSEMSRQSTALVKNLNIDYQSVLRQSAIDTGISITESAFEKTAGIAGIALEGMFKVGDTANHITQLIHTSKCADAGVVRIDALNSNGELVDNGIRVKVLNEYLNDFVFRGYAVTDGDDYSFAKKALGIKKDNFKLYQLYMMLEDEVTSPAAITKVSIPLPEGYSADKAKVYRVEENGKYTDMQAVVEDGYLVFETNHFSLYVVTPKSVKQINYGLIVAVTVVVELLLVFIIWLFVRKRKKDEDKRTDEDKSKEAIK